MISGHGTQFTWGTVTFSLTSVSISSSADEVEITSMSSYVRTDPLNTNSKRVVRDYDSGSAGDTTINVEFVAGPWINTLLVNDWVGQRRDLFFRFPANDLGQGTGFGGTAPAVLTQISLGASTGDYVRGSAVFRLSGR